MVRLAAQSEIIDCRRCPRLVIYRGEVARTKVRRYRDWEYWGRPVPSLGPLGARLLVVGLAPAAHGGNRTGRIFTGDRSGDWLYRALYNFGFSNRPTSTHRGDGLRLIDCYITAAVQRLKRVRVVVALGMVAFKTYFAARKQLGQINPTPLPPFGHELAAGLADGVTIISSYHPSQQNTQTGKLTETMLDAVFRNARRILDGP